MRILTVFIIFAPDLTNVNIDSLKTDTEQKKIELWTFDV